MTTSRRRFTPQRRRGQLLEIGARLFGERPYDDVWIEEVAELAGVSRGLMYHYFPSKRDFFTAVIEREHEQLLAATEVDPTLPIGDQIRDALEAYVDHFIAHPHSFLVVNRGVFAADATVQQLLDREQQVLRSRLLRGLGLDESPSGVASMAVWGWLVFIRTVCVDWMATGSVDRDQLIDLCLRTLIGALGPEVDLDGLPRASD